MVKYFLMLLLSFVFVGCNSNSFNSYKNEVCQISQADFDNLDKCKNGEVLLFTPERWGTNDTQTPVQLAAYACDFNYPILHNPGALSCIFKNRYESLKQSVKKSEDKDNSTQK